MASLLGLMAFALTALLTTANDVTREVDMTVPQLINYWGYPVEEVRATTEDGYILTMHRIPYGRKSGPAANKPVVFLQHGLEACSANWVSNLPHQSAAFILADHGFDVWLGNMRGNMYSKAHTSLNPSSHDFWKFSFDHMVKYDLDAMIDTALARTNQTGVYYVGHSQGTLTMFSKLSRDQSFHRKIKKFFALAPVGTVKHIEGLLSVVAKMFYNLVRLGSTMFGAGEFLPNTEISRMMSKIVCGSRSGEALCDNLMFLMTGVDSKQLNKTRTALYASHVPAGTSVQNILHWAQMVRTGELRQYQFVTDRENVKHYGNKIPPKYELSKDNAPVHLYWSAADWLADRKDIEEFLIPALKKDYLVENNELKDFNHMDFVFGLRAPEEIYYPIMNKIREELQLPPVPYTPYY